MRDGYGYGYGYGYVYRGMRSKETIAAQVFLANHGFVEGMALKHAPWPGLADDIVQQVFLEFTAKERQWDLESDAKPLLATMTRFVALRHWREQMRQKPEMVRKLADHVRQLAGENQEETRYDDELTALRDCLQKLPDRTRAFIDLYYYENLSTGEIASKMHMRPNTVCRALCRMREKLRECLIRQLQGGFANA